MEIIYKEVYFDKYCEKCKFFSLKDYEEPCNECLDTPFNEYTSKPVKWKEKDKK